MRMNPIHWAVLCGILMLLAFLLVGCQARPRQVTSPDGIAANPVTLTRVVPQR